MPITAAEKIRLIAKRRHMSLTSLADALGTSRQNLNDKLVRDNFTEKDLIKIAAALDCTYESTFVLNDTKEKI